MQNISDLNPIIWGIFNEILTVPRPSKKEELIRQYLVDFAKKHNLESIVDAKGNVVIVREAANGFESKNGIVLQSHMDMVCEKESTLEHDFLKDPINAYVEDGWVKARGTTLGADCGIGMAMQLAALIDPDFCAPKIEALFTVDEEQGLSGAMELDPNILSGKYLINLDSEDEGEIFIGCAGGIDTLATFDVNFTDATKNCGVKIAVNGLLGGHSGDDIEKGRACANKLIIRALWALNGVGFELVTIDGGNLRNAIAREAYAIVRIDSNNYDRVSQILVTLFDNVKNEFAHTDADVNMTFERCEASEAVLIEADARRLIMALQAIKHGVVGFSATMKGLVETSTNLASVKFDGSKVTVVTSQRSSIESAKIDIANTVEATLLLAGANVKHSDGYPGWEPNPSSTLVQNAEKTYTQIYNKQPKVKAIHAGLECGLILKKYPHMEAISIGPTLRGVHSPSERLEIQTVDQVWVFLKELVKVLY